MKTLKSTLLIGLMTLLLSPLSFAQDFDANRMNRDIKIMENILGEVFKTSLNTYDNRGGNRMVFVNSLTNQNNIKGTYVPNYGVIFMIPNPTPNYINIVRRDDNEAKVVFEYASDENGEKMELDEESITNRIKEFLKDYASTINQLKPDERVMVVYGEKRNEGRELRVLSIAGNGDNEETKEKPLPVITVSVKKSDLDALRSGRLSTEAFEDRLAVSTSEGKEYLDLKVMANILKTAFAEGDGDELHLISNNSLSYLRIDNFGALYTLNLHRGHGLQSFNIRAFTQLRNTDTDEEKRRVQELEEEREKLKNTLKEEYSKLITLMKDYMVDYGRTLNSLSNEEYLMVSANISDSQDVIPSRVNFQIKKSVFEQLDRGQISREDAINAVTITEY